MCYTLGEGMTLKERNEEGIHEASFEEMGQSFRSHEDRIYDLRK